MAIAHAVLIREDAPSKLGLGGDFHSTSREARDNHHMTDNIGRGLHRPLFKELIARIDAAASVSLPASAM